MAVSIRRSARNLHRLAAQSNDPQEDDIHKRDKDKDKEALFNVAYNVTDNIRS